MEKLFIDTEFTDLHQNTSLISLGIVSESGSTFYAEFTDYDKSQLDAWLLDNVVEKLHLTEDRPQDVEMRDENGVHFTMRGCRRVVREALECWLVTLIYGLERRALYNTKNALCTNKPMFELWSDCAWDFVLFHSLWGGAFDVPKCIHYIHHDIATLFVVAREDPDVSREGFSGLTADVAQKHNALHDAKVIKACFDKLIDTIANL